MSRDRAALQQALGAALRTYQRSVDAFDEAAAAFLGVNRTDLRCLDLLLEQGQATPGYLGDALGLTSGSVTAMLDRLERMGLVARRPDPADRRRVEVTPTGQALAAAERLWGPLIQDGARIVGRYSGPELELMIGVLEAIQSLQDVHTTRVRALRTSKRR